MSNSIQTTSASLSDRPSAAQRTKVTVLVPCYNEQEACAHFRDNLNELRESLIDTYDFSFVVVDDGSSDGTCAALRETFADDDGVRIVQHQVNRGIGAAIMTGLKHTRTEIVCSMDFDCSYDPRQFSKMIPLLTPDVDVVTASPYHPEGKVRNVPRWRLSLSKAASVMYSFLLDSQLFTYTSCFRVYRRSAVVGIELRNEGFVGVVELLWEVDRRGGRIIECPAELGVREYGQSKMRTLAVMLGHLKLMASGIARRTWL